MILGTRSISTTHLTLEANERMKEERERVLKNKIQSPSIIHRDNLSCLLSCELLVPYHVLRHALFIPLVRFIHWKWRRSGAHRHEQMDTRPGRVQSLGAQLWWSAHYNRRFFYKAHLYYVDRWTKRERVRKLDPVDGGIDNNGSRLCI